MAQYNGQEIHFHVVSGRVGTDAAVGQVSAAIDDTRVAEARAAEQAAAAGFTPQGGGGYVGGRAGRAYIVVQPCVAWSWGGGNACPARPATA